MNTNELIQALGELVKEKGIDREFILTALEAALVSAYKKNYGTSQNVKVTINRETGELHVYGQKKVVEIIEDELLELDLEAARKMNITYNIDDIVDIEVTPKDFGRVAAQSAKQRVVQEIREAEREIIFKEFIEKENDIITGIIEKKEKQNVLVDIFKTETLLTPNEQIPGEQYNHGDRLKFYVVEVKKTSKGPNIVISRTHPGLVKRLFEMEVPEIYEGIVEIKSISREAGSRTKIAVFSRDENVDATGACVGPKGIRVQTVVNELKGEKIDIVKWSKDAAEFISNALSPAKVVSAMINEADKSAKVTVPDYQLSLAIGKEGQNARLAAKLTGWKIDIKSETQAGALKEEMMRMEAEAELEAINITNANAATQVEAEVEAQAETKETQNDIDTDDVSTAKIEATVETEAKPKTKTKSKTKVVTADATNTEDIATVEKSDVIADAEANVDADVKPKAKTKAKTKKKTETEAE